MKNLLQKKQWCLVYFLLLLTPHTVWAEDSQYDAKTGKLSIPKLYVEPTHTGFQNLELLLKGDGTWLLTDFEILDLTPLVANNPPLNSVKTAHGNTDWHIDTAEEFLFGTEMSGAVTAANHVPSSWTRTHMHIGTTNANHFYHDSSKTTPGDDDDATSGIDTTMLFFYAGHGNPTIWNTLGNNSTQSNVLLGDGSTWSWSDSNRLRYYWQCSCQVFAHGPRTCASSTWDYGCPGDFDGSSDSSSMRNVYERWGPALGNNLRMACGASTSAYCHESQTNRIWDNYNNKGYDVADSFIDGLNWWDVVPLCITMGGADVTKSPLYDTVFTNQPNSSGTSYYHIQYLSNFARKSKWPQIVIKIPEFLPVYKMIPMPLPPMLEKVEFIKLNEELRVSDEEIQARGPMYKVNNKSGAVYVVGESKHALGVSLKDQEYVEIASKFLAENGWTEEDVFEEPLGVRTMVASTPVEKAANVGPFDPQGQVSSQKNVRVAFKRIIRVDDLMFDVLGEGGSMVVHMNNDGSILNASKVWRGIVQDGANMVKVKGFDEAFEEAQKQLENVEMYELKEGDWAFGYKAESGNVEQDQLSAVYQFQFTPIEDDEKTLLIAPPVMVEIMAQEL